MDINELEKIDTTVISDLIVSRLPLPLQTSQKENLLSPKPQALQDVIADIEKIEHEWKLDTADEGHTYGRKHAGETIQLWSVPPKSAQVLENLVVLTGAKTILEIGTSAGYAALFLAHGAKANGGHVYTIELLKEKADLARGNFDKSGLDNITLIEDEASKVLSAWDNGKIDFVFLDADKENYGKYFDQLVPLMNISGLIVADNVNDYGHMMEDYLQKVSGTHLPKTRTDHRVKSYYLAMLENGLMVTQKISE
ncbi:MAG: class I SAM-dependent methyltransferase [bacterium]